ncbi:hypothetical protein F2P56_019380, partial [Juglans regia]
SELVAVVQVLLYIGTRDACKIPKYIPITVTPLLKKAITSKHSNLGLKGFFILRDVGPTLSATQPQEAATAPPQAHNLASPWRICWKPRHLRLHQDSRPTNPAYPGRPRPGSPRRNQLTSPHLQILLLFPLAPLFLRLPLPPHPIHAPGDLPLFLQAPGPRGPRGMSCPRAGFWKLPSGGGDESDQRDSGKVRQVLLSLPRGRVRRRCLRPRFQLCAFLLLLLLPIIVIVLGLNLIRS